MNIKYFLKLSYNNFLFWVSRKIDYPLAPPDSVQINFTFNCNLACKMCSMYERKEFLKVRGRQTEIDSVIIKKIIKETKDLGTKTILFIGGEPLLKKDLFNLVNYTKSFNLNPIIVTNGVLLNEDNIKRCFDSGLDWLSISIDAVSENTFRNIRGEDILGKVIQNIKVLNDMKKNMKKEFPKIVVVCTIMDDNLHELLDIVRLCKRLEVAKIIFQPVVANNIDQTKRESIFPGFIPPERYRVLDEIVDKLISYKKESLENFSFIANSIGHLKLIKKYFKGYLRPWELPCYAGYNRLQIIQEGKIYFCVPQDKYEANFGDIKKDTLSDLWFSKEAKMRRKLIRKCKTSCLQWCAYRDGFMELSELFQKPFLFKNKFFIK